MLRFDHCRSRKQSVESFLIISLPFLAFSRASRFPMRLAIHLTRIRPASIWWRLTTRICRTITMIGTQNRWPIALDWGYISHQHCGNMMQESYQLASIRIGGTSFHRVRSGLCPKGIASRSAHNDHFHVRGSTYSPSWCAPIKSGGRWDCGRSVDARKCYR